MVMERGQFVAWPEPTRSKPVLKLNERRGQAQRTDNVCEGLAPAGDRWGSSLARRASHLVGAADGRGNALPIERDIQLVTPSAAGGTAIPFSR